MTRPDPTPSPALAKLISLLDASSQPITRDELASAFTSAALTPSDVQSYVRVSPSTYTRARVVRRDNYELLILTWAPGQSSGPHDHAGSLCGLQVLQGTLHEQYYTDAPDGFADPTSHHTELAPALTIDPGIAIHCLSNPSPPHTNSDDLLVTVHVYSPPLAELRRHIPRPPGTTPAPVFTSKPAADARRVVIIGGGFSGALAAAHLLRATPNFPLDITLIDRHSAIAEGVAYRTTDPRHLLNVPAARMSAFPDQPDHFLNFARTLDPTIAPTDFLPRKLYALYLRDTFDRAARSAPPSTTCRLLRDSAESISPSTSPSPPMSHRWSITTASNPSLPADAVILALGHRPPADPFARRWTGPRSRWIADPWASFTLSAIRPDEPVLLLGSGLTAIDTLLSLDPANRSAPIHLLSPRGLLPQSHATTPIPPLAPPDLEPFLARLISPTGLSPRALLHMLRTHAQTSALDWRQTIDAVRRHTPQLWLAMSHDQRDQFLRHARRYWEIHRHRMAPSIATQLADFQRTGKVLNHAGRACTFLASPSDVAITYSVLNAPPKNTPPKNAPTTVSSHTATLHVAWVVNCTGPGIDIRTRPHPVLRSLLNANLIAPCDLGLGLQTSASGCALDPDGNPHDSLHILGTLRKSTLWESTAVPELRQQAALAAQSTLSLLSKPLPH